MLTLPQRINRWKQWLNRNKQFSPEEMEELEYHLREEILSLTEHEGLSESSAFDKALDILGEKGLLDEEFGKIRWSKFDKVKLWAYLQTILCIALIIFVVVPYIHIPKEETLDPFVGERIGTINSWMKENMISNIVTSKKETYFYNHYLNNILCYEESKEPFTFTDVRFKGMYNFPEPEKLRYEILRYSCFDIDSENFLYALRDNFGESYQIDVYKNSALIKNIENFVPIEVNMSYLKNFKVFDRKILIYFEIYPIDPLQTDPLQTTYHMFIYDMDTKEKRIETIPIKSQVVSIDRSGDEFAILTRDGEILIYSLQNWNLKLLKKLQIQKMSKYFQPEYFFNMLESSKKIKKIKFIPYKSEVKYLPRIPSGPSLLFTKNNHQMVLKTELEKTKYYWLTHSFSNQLEPEPMISEAVKGVIKLYYQGAERLVSIRNDQPMEEYNSYQYAFSNIYRFDNKGISAEDGLYLFKD